MSTEKIIVTKELLKDNPDLAADGVAVGDEIEVPAEETKAEEKAKAKAKAEEKAKEVNPPDASSIEEAEEEEEEESDEEAEAKKPLVAGKHRMLLNLNHDNVPYSKGKVYQLTAKQASHFRNLNAL